MTDALRAFSFARRQGSAPGRVRGTSVEYLYFESGRSHLDRPDYYADAGDDDVRARRGWGHSADVP
eukprot:2495968-Pyramimonas_sp.AAC.1